MIYNTGLPKMSLLSFVLFSDGQSAISRYILLFFAISQRCGGIHILLFRQKISEKRNSKQKTVICIFVDDELFDLYVRLLFFPSTTTCMDTQQLPGTYTEPYCPIIICPSIVFVGRVQTKSHVIPPLYYRMKHNYRHVRSELPPVGWMCNLFRRPVTK